MDDRWWGRGMFQSLGQKTGVHRDWQVSYRISYHKSSHTTFYTPYRTSSQQTLSTHLAVTTTATTPKRKFASFANAKQKGSPTGPLASAAGSPQTMKLDQTLVAETREVDEFGKYLLA